MAQIQQPPVLFVIVILAVISACNNSSDKKTDARHSSNTETSTAPVNEMIFENMLGTWQSEDGKSFERWTKNDIGGYNAVVFSIRDKDTSWKEQANIYLENSKWIFENTVKGQNDGKAIKFASILLEPNSVQFTNEAHDFPTDINYTVKDSNTLTALIFGRSNKGGNKEFFSFNYKRLK